MKTVSAAEANRQFSRLLREAQAGETITITSRGKPVAQLAPIAEDKAAKDKAWAAFVEELRQMPAQRLGKFDRNWAYDD